MKQRSQFPLTEAEGGAPEFSAYDIATSRIPEFPNNLFLPYVTTGTAKGSTMFPGIAGLVAEGMGSVQPVVVPDYFYFGEAPLSLQGTLDKPYPWEPTN
jgi:hypothetical protein